MELIGARRAAIFDHDHIEALVGETSHRGRHALVGKDAGQDDVLDIHVAQDKAQVRAGEGAVRRLAQDDLVIARGEVGNELRFLAGSRHEQIVPPGFFLAQRAVPTVRLETGDPGEQTLDSMSSEEIDERARVRNDDIVHPVEERRPALLLGGAARDCHIFVLDVDHEQRCGGTVQHQIFGLRRSLVVERPIGGLPSHDPSFLPMLFRTSGRARIVLQEPMKSETFHIYASACDGWVEPEATRVFCPDLASVFVRWGLEALGEVVSC